MRIRHLIGNALRKPADQAIPIKAVRKRDQRAEPHQRAPRLFIAEHVVPAHDVGDKHQADDDQRGGGRVYVVCAEDSHGQRQQHQTTTVSPANSASTS